MEYDLCLLWTPNDGWGVFMSGCPDTGAFPNWMYKKYSVPDEKRNEVFKRLINLKGRLETDKIIPKKDKEKEIFPELSDLLKD